MTKYFVSPSGSDKNHGKSERLPFKTIKFAKKHIGRGNGLLLKSGAVFDEGLGHWKRSNCFIGTYGGEDPAILKGELYFQDRVSDISLYNLTFRGFGITWTAEGRNFRLERVNVFDAPIGVTLHPEGEAKLDSVALVSCSIRNCYRETGLSQGLYANGVDRLSIVGCFFSHNGWIEDHQRSQFSHNILIDDNCGPVDIQRCAIDYASSFGVMMKSGGWLIGNSFRGNAGAWLACKDIVCRQNKVSEPADISLGMIRKWGGVFENIGRGACVGNIFYGDGVGQYPLILDGRSPEKSIDYMDVKENLFVDWIGKPFIKNVKELKWGDDNCEF